MSTLAPAGLVPPQAIRNAFDYEHGGFVARCDRDNVLIWLRRLMPRSLSPKPEDSGDLFRIWCPNIAGYFWPEDETEDRWQNAA